MKWSKLKEGNSHIHKRMENDLTKLIHYSHHFALISANGIKKKLKESRTEWTFSPPVQRSSAHNRHLTIYFTSFFHIKNWFELEEKWKNPQLSLTRLLAAARHFPSFCILFYAWVRVSWITSNISISFSFLQLTKSFSGWLNFNN